MNKTLTIATICLNAEKEIAPTLESIHGQTCREFEHLVIDGGSKDGTLEVIRQYGDKVNRVISEPDRGIADAFNKAARLATGRTLILMNAGDRFVDSQVIERVLPQLEQMNNLESVVAYGDFLLDWNGTLRPAVADATLLPSTTAICHQASFVGRQIYTTMEYDIRIPTAMDYDFWLRVQGRYDFVHLKMPICVYRWGGVSCLPERNTRNMIELLMVQLLNRKAKPTTGLLLGFVGKVWMRNLKERIRAALGESVFVKIKQLFGLPAR